MKTLNTSKKIDLIDFFSKDVISERIRVDPRENEIEEYCFEVIQEIESDEDLEDKGKTDEEVTNNLKMDYYNADKWMHAS